MRILVVEDQKKVLAFVQRGLKESGYSVDAAQSGEAAETFAAENEYDLVILDVMLAGQNGIDTARNLRRDGFNKGILMLTALSSTKDKVNGLDAGADDYLTKPFSFDELLARVRALLRRQSDKQDSGSILKFQDLEIDLLKRKATRGNRPLNLTQKEFSLLEYFLRNPDRPLSRTSIAEHVWDAQFDSGSNVIDVYINLLRKKVDHGARQKLLHTVVGFGYVLRTEANS